MTRRERINKMIAMIKKDPKDWTREEKAIFHENKEKHMGDWTSEGDKEE